MTGSAVVNGGGEVKFENAASTNWVNGDLLLTFTNLTEGMSFTLPGTTSARILAIGGGGGGGAGYMLATAGQPYGGGGGGGAGGFVELSSALYGAGIYSVTVGAGGAAAALGANRKTVPIDYSGADGGDTSIMTNGVSLVTAYGGGGGGGECAGRPGGSGGGGSMLWVSKTEGTTNGWGEAVSGQGNHGGLGNGVNFGGGGGGAGGVGLDATNVVTGAVGEGGAGLQSDITGLPEWYAAGGGGGCNNSKATGPTTGIPGGSGIGGFGGVGNKKFAATAGVDGTGSGGGGASYNVVGGRGGSGVVYIRISATMRGEFKKPDSYVEHTFSNNVEYVSVQNTIFYDVEGANRGSTAGVYVATATLKSGTWPDKTTDPVKVTMVIKPCEAEFSGLSIKSWTFGDETIPEPSCGVSPEWVEAIYQWKEKGEGSKEEGWTNWDDSKPTEAGAYELRVGAPNTNDYAFAYRTVDFSIAKVHVEFANLRISDWVEGDAFPPDPSCAVVPMWVEPVFEYKREQGTGNREQGEEGDEWDDWTTRKPDKAGSYILRVRAPDDDNYEGNKPTYSFKIVRGPGNIFVDYVEITVNAYAGTAEFPQLTNFPYRVTLSETDPVGFLYERAGPDGDQMAFTDDTGDNALDYKVDAWNPDGTSTVYVKIPLITNAVQKIRLYWCVRDGAKVPDHHPETVWTDWPDRETYDRVVQPGSSFGLVKRDGKLVNYWDPEPTLDPREWNAGDPPGVLTPGRLADGCPVVSNIIDSAGTAFTDFPTNPGVYRITFRPNAPEGVYDIKPFTIDFKIVGRIPIDDLTDGANDLTLGGRVMLFNDDIAEGHEVKGQGYWQLHEVAGTKYDTYWTHTGTHAINREMPYLLDGVDHKLHHIDATGRTNVLWRFEDIMIGNQFKAETGLSSSKCYLPYSTSARGISTASAGSKQATRVETGSAVMRNSTAAVLYSPCYTNGIGTIYFDAVNGDAIDGTTFTADKYRLVVEIATETADGKDPTDENASGRDDNTGVDTELGRLATKWKPWAMIPLKRDNNTLAFERLAETNDLALAIAKGGSLNNFYRVCVKVNHPKAARFRIRRVSKNDGMDIDDGSVILIDNILVSFPQSTAELKPRGVYDETRGGKRTLGQECALANVAFPSVNDEELFGWARLTNYVSAATDADPRTFVQRAWMHYRWRYLNQVFEPEAAGTPLPRWRSVELSPFDDFAATDPLEVPADVGDIEFWYELETMIPFYDYFDYSGADAARQTKLGGQYTEEQTSVTNAWWVSHDESATLPSCGRDWFVRLRAGRSDWEEIGVTVGTQKEEPMELIGDGLWRGLVKIPTNLSGDVNFTFKGHNRQRAGEDFARNTVLWRSKGNVARLPGRGEIEETHGADPGRTFPGDGASGYIEFQFNEENGLFSIGHAEYQTFNAWHDAWTNAETFVGNYVETSGVNIAEMTQTNAPIRSWATLETWNENWNESFIPVSRDFLDPGFPKFVNFATHNMPHGWTGANGQFVDAQLVKSNLTDRMESSGLAWQMKGEGLGSISFTQDGPSGLDALAFDARLAQSIDFWDVSYWYGNNSAATNNYTFLIPAIMSCNSSATSIDYAPGAVISVFGYYQPMAGAYEFRAERLGSDGLQLSIYKWSIGPKYRMTSTLLGSRWFSGATLQNSDGSNKPDMFAVFISLGATAAGETTIVGGVSTAKAAPNNAFSAVAYNAIRCVDADDPFTKGSVGVLSASCPARFFEPRIYSKYLTTYKTGGTNAGTDPKDAAHPAFKGYYASKSITLEGTRDRTFGLKMLDDWAYTPGRAQNYVNSNYGLTPNAQGIRAPTDLDQTVDVYVKPRNGGGWEYLDQVKVSSYAFETHTLTVRTNANWHVMLQAGEAPADVTVHTIAQTGWNGADMPRLDSTRTDFGYTQAMVYDEYVQNDDATVTTNRYAKLQPARTAAGQPLSVRSPVMKGLGLIGFSYGRVSPGCEVWVQVATNKVEDNLTEYDHSVKEGTDVGEWQTVRKYDYAALQAAGGSVSCHIGWHDHLDDPLRGLVRILVPTNVVNAAAGQRIDKPDYGAIWLTDVWTHDEPALNTKCWIGWNMRVTGDASDSERRMYLPDTALSLTGNEIGTGLSAGLNNSYTRDIDGDPEFYDDNNPFIQSPTFGKYVVSNETRQATIGQVRFRARLYETNETAAAANPGRIALYGVMDGAQESSRWTFLTNYTISSTRYRQFDFKAKASVSFAAIRLVVDGVIDEKDPSPQRILLDEVVVSEKSDSKVGFLYARPFRDGVNADRPVPDILDMAQQPLCGESWGIQTQLKLDQMDNDIDLTRGFRVTMRYFIGEKPWGYAAWSTAAAASPEIALKQVGEKKDWIFRSSISNPDSILKPISDSGAVVQYVITAYYYQRGNDDEQDAMIAVTDIAGDGWTNPAWYEPIDYNRETNGVMKADTSPYTILDSLSPGRAWINEVNYNDGFKNETGGMTSVTNQFIEIAVPRGVDMKGWKVVMTDFNHVKLTLAEFGKNGVPTSKNSKRHSGDYDFLVLQSPASQQAGGIRDYLTGEPVADGTWVASTLSSTFSQGTLQFEEPYQFELVRPSGIIEHQFVVAGTNDYRTSSWFDTYGYRLDGTNLVNELNLLEPSPNRFFAGEDTAWKASDGVTPSSIGVTADKHGEDGGWSADMRFTPGRLNEGQEELTDWFIRPNGGSIWIYAQVFGDHLHQTIGDDTLADTYVVVSSGSSTNIDYKIDRWYQIDSLTVNDVTNAAATAQKGTWRLSLNNVTETTYVVAREGISSELIGLGLDPADRYTPAVMKWLEAGVTRNAAGQEVPFANPNGPFTNAIYRGLCSNATNELLSVRGMYWFDIDPTEPGWWLRAGTQWIDPHVMRKRKNANGEIVDYDNKRIVVKMYLSNDVSRVVHPPYRLQGVGGERSDAFSGSWTSVTFKVTAYLRNDEEGNVGWLPFRWFTFGPDSFGSIEYPAGTEREYSSVIELVDPHSEDSPGYGYGWWRYPDAPIWVWWTINDQLQATGVEKLKADSTYKDQPLGPYIPE